MYLIRINIKIMFLTVIVTNQHVYDKFSKPFKSYFGKNATQEVFLISFYFSSS